MIIWWATRLILQRYYVVSYMRNRKAGSGLLPPPLRGRVGMGGFVGESITPHPAFGIRAYD